LVRGRLHSSWLSPKHQPNCPAPAQPLYKPFLSKKFVVVVVIAFYEGGKRQVNYSGQQAARGNVNPFVFPPRGGLGGVCIAVISSVGQVASKASYLTVIFPFCGNRPELVYKLQASISRWPVANKMI
jgi:hypothetical protein